MIASNEWLRMWKETVLSRLEVLFQYRLERLKRTTTNITVA